MHATLTQATEPFTPLTRWMAEAAEAEPRVHDAAQLATVGPDGRPSIRTVLIKGYGPDGLLFYTNLGSRKGYHLAGTDEVALLLHWKSLERQVAVEGRAVPVPDADADAYWETRPRGSQIGAWASRQSEAVQHPDTLLQRVEQANERFEGQAVPRPSFWGGFAVAPNRVEFWQGRPDRLHERLLFDKTVEGWDVKWLYP